MSTRERPQPRETTHCLWLDRFAQVLAMGDWLAEWIVKVGGKVEKRDVGQQVRCAVCAYARHDGVCVCVGLSVCLCVMVPLPLCLSSCVCRPLKRTKAPSPCLCRLFWCVAAALRGPWRYPFMCPASPRVALCSQFGTCGEDPAKKTLLICTALLLCHCWAVWSH
jgi:hypothetical protein